MSGFASDEELADIDIDLPEGLDEQLQEQFKTEFLADIEDCLKNVSTLLEDMLGADDQSASLKSMIGIIHTIKGQAAAINYPAIEQVAHQWEDFLDGKNNLNDVAISEMYIYTDIIHDLTSQDNQPDEKTLARIIGALPNNFSAHDIIQDRTDIQILSILPDNVQRKVIEDEIKACGFKITQGGSSFNALEIAVRTQPHLIITTMMIDVIDGLELAQMVRASKMTKHIPVIVLTSGSNIQLSDGGLPDKTMVVAKGQSFAEDLSQAMIALGIFE